MNTSQPKKTALLVDDDQLLIQLVSMLLERAHVNTVIAHNGREAFERLEEFSPDIIMLDMMMPEMDGLSFLKLLRAQNRFDTIPVIVMSAVDEPEVIQEALSAGAVEFLQKPVQIPVLLEKIKSVLAPHA